MRRVLVDLLPGDNYFPGLGILLGLVLIYSVGVLLNLFLIARLWDWFERLLNKVPLVKTVYSAISDFLGYFSSSVSEDSSKVAVVDLGEDRRLVGLVTDESPSILGSAGTEMIAIYLPMSYQVGGYTIIVPKSRVELLDTTVEEAMRWVLTAGIRKPQARQ